MKDDDIPALKAEVDRLRARVRSLEHGPESNALLRSVAESAPDNIMLLDLEGRIRFINRTVPDLTKDQVIGTPVTEFVPPEYQDGIHRCLERVRASGEPDRYETSYVAEDGDISYWESRVSPVMRGEAIDGFVVHSTNVSERRRATTDRDRFFNLSLDMLCVASTDGYFKRVNPAFERTLGYAEDEMLSAPFLDFIHPDDHEITVASVAQLQGGQDVIDFENRYRSKSGEYRWLSWRATAEASGKIYAIARDVTDRRVLEEQARQSQKMDAVGQLAGGIAHDFNNLVLAIQINSEFVRDKLADPDAVIRHLEEIDRATGRAANLTRQLLAFSRRQSFDTREVAVDTLIDDLLKLLRRLIPENIDVTLTTAPGIPAIKGDASQIEQLVMNLCVNARDAMPQGGVLRISVDARRLDSEFCSAHRWARPGNYLCVSVQDDGEGISPEVRERMFEPFFTTKAPGRGNGLGLATAYGIAKQHGGFIHVESEPGDGARFEVFLPSLDRPSLPDDAPAGSVAEGPNGRGETILVAEDDEMVRRVVVQLLEHAGYHVVQAVDGEQALSLFREHMDVIDAVLLDIMMPNMSGPEALEGMRAMKPALRAIVSTGYSGDTWHAGALVPETVVQKPYVAATLLTKLRKILDR